jgi:uncharacterized protein (DUF2141 family)
MRIYLIVLTVSLVLSCAKQGFPPGGPEDKSPPVIVGTFPEMGALNVPLDTEIQILFNEPIQRISAQDHIFITPNPGAEVHFKWRRKKLRIRFSEDLNKDRTYVIALGSGIRDYRNNTMTETAILAFSTGRELDQGQISGVVFVEEKGASVWAYPLDAKEPDPRTEKPEYTVQCGKDGSFQFSYLALKRYRLFAVLDRLADQLYRPTEDAVGLTSRDIDLRTVSSAGPVFFQMTREDTLAPRLIRAGAVRNNLIFLQFNEAVQVTDSVQITVSADSASMTLHGSGLYSDPENEQRILANISPQAGGEWSVTVAAIHDLAGHPVDSLYQTARFTASADPDTLPPRVLTIAPARGQQNVRIEPVIDILFSEAVDSTLWQSHVTLKAMESRLPLKADRMIPNHWLIRTQDPLDSRTSYQLSLDSIADYAGNVFDTSLTFMTLNVDTLSSILGDVECADSSDAVILTLQDIRGKERYDLRIAKPGEFQFDSIFPGMYTLSAYQDMDGNGRYSYGQVIPFKPAEPFAVLPDTIKARSRWSNGGNTLILR